VSANHDTRPKEIDHFPSTGAVVGIQTPTGLVNAVLSGAATVEVALDSLHTVEGLEAVDTELVTMELVGAGGVRLRAGRAHGLPASKGGIREKVNRQAGRVDLPGPERPFCLAGECEGAQADSFFDVFFEVEVGGQVLHNGEPLRMEAVIDRKPPQTIYTHVIPRPIPLLTREGKESGLFLVSANHDTRPPPEIEEDVLEHTSALVGLRLRDGRLVNLVLSGGALVHVDLSKLGDSQNNGLEEVPTELVDMELSGAGYTLVAGRNKGQKPTFGSIEENRNIMPGRLDLPGPDAPLCTPPVPPDCVGATATSDFAVFFEVRTPDGLRLHNRDPLRMASVITEKPPRTSYRHIITRPIPLFGPNDEPTGILLVTANHDTRGGEIDVFPNSHAQITLAVPGAPNQVIGADGPTTVVVNIGPNGEAGDTDGNGRNDVRTEIVELRLTGIGPQGPVEIGLNPNKRSFGQIEEQTNAKPGTLEVPPFGEGKADSFFDVFVEVKLPDGTLVHNESPIHLATVITHKPPAPGEGYQNPFDQAPIVLFTRDGRDSGVRLLQEIHTPVPPEIDFFRHSLARITVQQGDLTEVVTLAGPTQVSVGVGPRGEALMTDGSGHDRVPTEMTLMNLRGFSKLFGRVAVRLDRTRPTKGDITELENNVRGILEVPPFARGRAKSSFDVFAEFVVGEGASAQVFHTSEPFRMESIITHKPPRPGEEYVNPFERPIELLDAANRPIGVRLVKEIHIPNPPVEVDIFRESGAVIVLSLPDPTGQPRTEEVRLQGGTRVHVLIPPNGWTADTDGDGLDQAPSEMTELALKGTSSLGTVEVVLDRSRPTTGELEELVNQTTGTLDVPPFTPEGGARSHFDVNFLVRVGDRVLHTARPIRMETIIRHKPPRPGEQYTNPFLEPVELLGPDGQPTGIKLVKEVHTPIPHRPVISIWDVSSGGLRRMEVRARELARWYTHLEWSIDSRLWLKGRAEGLWITQEALRTFSYKSHCIIRNPRGTGVWQIWRTFRREDVVRFEKHYRISWLGHLNPFVKELDPENRQYALSIDHAELTLPLNPSDPNPETPVNEAVMIIDEKGQSHMLGEAGFEATPDTAGNPGGFQLLTTAASSKFLPAAAERIQRSSPAPMPGMANLQPGVIIQWLVDDNGNVLVDEDGKPGPDPIHARHVLGNLRQGVLESPTDQEGHELTLDQAGGQTRLYCWELTATGEVRGATPGQIVIGPPADLDGDGAPDRNTAAGGPAPVDPTLRELVTDAQGNIAERVVTDMKPVDWAAVEEGPVTDVELAAYNDNLKQQLPNFVPPEPPFDLCIREVKLRGFWGICRRVVYDAWLQHLKWRIRHHVTLQRGAYRVWITRKAVTEFESVQIHRLFGQPPVRRTIPTEHIRFFRVCYRVLVLGPDQVRVKVDRIFVCLPEDPSNPRSRLMLLTTHGNELDLNEVPPRVLAGLEPDPFPTDANGVFVEEISDVAGVRDMTANTAGVFEAMIRGAAGTPAAPGPVEFSVPVQLDAGMDEVTLVGNSDSSDELNDNQLPLYGWMLNEDGTLAEDTYDLGDGKTLTLGTGPSGTLPLFQDENGQPVSDATPLASETMVTETPLVDEIALQAGQISISWSAEGFVLEGADQVTGPWTQVATQSPYSTAPTGQAKFFRLRAEQQ
jgi:hypothetical protein